MSSTTGRSAIRLATLILLALLIGGCGEDSASPTAAPATTTTAAPTTTPISRLNAEELAWLKGISAVRTKVEHSLQAMGSGQVTRAIMLEHSRELAAWSRQLRRLGAPTDRLQPAYTIVRKVIRTYDKGAKCFATAAGGVSASGAVAASTPDVQIVAKAMDCAGAAHGTGTNMLYKADAKATELKAKYG
jgi:hypothetical protein